jgi:transcriptional regulator with XRE-family HTH domain
MRLCLPRRGRNPDNGSGAIRGMNMEFGKKIVAERQRHHWTQEELATQLNVTRQTLSRWESNVSKPDVDSLGKMATLFGVSSDYFFAEEGKVEPVPAFLKRDFAKQEKSGWVLFAISILFFLGSVGVIVYGALLPKVALIVVGAISALLFVLFLWRAVAILYELKATLRFAESNDKQGYLAWTIRRYDHAVGSKERWMVNLSAAYLDVDDLVKSRDCLRQIKNPIFLDLASPTRIQLLLEEGRYAEAKGISLSYIPRHQNGRSETENHTVSALHGLFHLLEGEMVSADEKEDASIIFDSPLGKRLLASAPWKKEKRDSAGVAESQSKEEVAATNTVFSVRDAAVGQGERKLQSWLNFSLIMCILFFVACFLVGALTVSPNDERILRNMWVMAFSSLVGALCILFGAIARKKEPKDHTLPLIIVGSITFILALLMALTALK